MTYHGSVSKETKGYKDIGFEQAGLVGQHRA